MTESAGQHCPCCISHLDLGPRAKRILLYLVQHNRDWEHDQNLEALRFKFIRGNDHSRVSWQPEYRARLEEVS